MKRRAPGGTDTHEYCNVCDARTPFLRQCPSASVALIDKCYDGATNHSAGFATLGLYVVNRFSRGNAVALMVPLPLPFMRSSVCPSVQRVHTLGTGRGY